MDHLSTDFNPEGNQTMSKSRMNFVLVITLLLVCAVRSFGQTTLPATREQINKLTTVLKSDAPHKEKADACRQLSIIGTKDVIAPLAALLYDEKLSHMARYGLEPIPGPAVVAEPRRGVPEATRVRAHARDPRIDRRRGGIEEDSV